MSRDPEDESPDIVFLQACVQAYYDGAPPSLRLAFPRPLPTANRSELDASDETWPLAVPDAMWDGRPQEDGRVHWKPVFVDPGPFNPFSPWRGPEAPLLRAFLTAARLCNPLIKTKAISFYLPNTPTHAPTQGMYWMTLAWGSLFDETPYYPFAITEDASQLLCLDVSQPDAGDHAPIVLFPAEVPFRRFNQPAAALAPARLLFASFRELLTQCLLHNDYAWAGDERSCQRVPARDCGLPPFSWGPLLLPDVDEDQEAPNQERADIDPKELAPHLQRLERKIEALRWTDPACLIPGSEVHRYRMNPKLLPEELHRFEQTEGCKLPVCYQLLLTLLGNGGFGSGQEMRRLEESQSGVFADCIGSNGDDADHLQRLFPHRRAWAPLRPALDEDDPEQAAAWEAYHSIAPIDGTEILGGGSGGRPASCYPVLLVVNGPERGHIWRDLRTVPAGPGAIEQICSGTEPPRFFAGPGIHPLMRRGPLSLLAWLEGAVDYLLAHLDGLYEKLPGHSGEEFKQAARRAFGFDRLPVP